MNPYNQNSLLVAVIILGIGVVGALVGAAQFRSASPSRVRQGHCHFHHQDVCRITAVVLLILLLVRYG
jgi:hypothetical protein